MDAKETLTYLYQHGHIICYADYKIICAELDKPITEHPDVQRLIGQVVELQAENESLKEKLLTPCVTCNAFIENDELKKFIEDNNILDMSEDLNYRMAILDGSWPQSVEILTRALENAKALKGQKDDI